MESDTEKGHMTKQCIKIDNLGPNHNFRRKSLKIAHLYLSSASLTRRPATTDVIEETGEEQTTKSPEGHVTKN